MDADKIAEFYADPVKRACDRHSLEKAYGLRALTTSPDPRHRLGRAARFLVHGGRGLIRRPEAVPAGSRTLGAPAARAARESS
jgi:hypothetical protein